MKKIIFLVLLVLIGCSDDNTYITSQESTKAALTAPANVRVLNCVLSWDAVDGAEFYKVYYGDKPDTYSGWNEVRGSTSYKIRNPQCHTVYLSVTAARGVEEGPFSEEVMINYYCR